MKRNHPRFFKSWISPRYITIRDQLQNATNHLRRQGEFETLGSPKNVGHDCHDVVLKQQGRNGLDLQLAAQPGLVACSCIFVCVGGNLEFPVFFWNLGRNLDFSSLV